MATRQSTTIAPFPDHIDRDYFGAYLSGLTDGEGCFYLGIHTEHPIPYMTFSIHIRNDDSPILFLIQSYLQCGTLHKRTPNRSTPNANPVRRLRFRDSVPDLKTVVNHFERYPLLAKKRHDFEVWKKAAELLITVKSRRCQYRNRGSDGRVKGALSKWQPGELDYYGRLREEMSHVRAYRETDEPSPIVAPPVIRQPVFPLFDLN